MGEFQPKKIGIIGGMGPAATVDLYNWIVKLTPARRDQDHIPVIIDSNPQIPDRTQYLLGQGEDPTPYLVSSAKTLERMGAEFIGMPCNTAHAFVDAIASQLQTARLVDMITETRDYVQQLSRKNRGSQPSTGLLASTGTIRTGLYQHYFADQTLVVPDPEVQECVVMDAVYGPKGIKAGHLRGSERLVREAIQHLQARGVKQVILGCTELPLALPKQRVNGVDIINPTRVLAAALVRESLNHAR